MRNLVLIGFALLLGMNSTIHAASQPSEIPGFSDHPIMSRFAGAVLQNAANERYVELRVVNGPGQLTDKGFQFDKSVSVAGKVSSYFYVAPKQATAVEVYRNYINALNEAKFSVLFSCELQQCEKAFINEHYSGQVVYPRAWSSTRMAPGNAVNRDVRFVSAKLNKSGGEVYVLLFVAEPNSVWEAPIIVLQVIEPAPLKTGNVVVNVDHLQKGLVEEGKIALYGIYFDSGRAELKSESTLQLNEMAKLLEKDKTLKVIIVGHTDNQGSTESNLTLSLRRAEAVVNALTTQYKIAANRLQARGLASFAPVATNRNDEGRAKNRRVELIEQ